MITSEFVIMNIFMDSLLSQLGLILLEGSDKFTTVKAQCHEHCKLNKYVLVWLVPISLPSIFSHLPEIWLPFHHFTKTWENHQWPLYSQVQKSFSHISLFLTFHTKASLMNPVISRAFPPGDLATTLELTLNAPFKTRSWLGPGSWADAWTGRLGEVGYHLCRGDGFICDAG